MSATLRTEFVKKYMVLMKKVILSCMIGNALEWYAFVIFGFFAPIISSQFFPETSHTVALMKAFSLFAMGFIARPLGAIVFGHIGDKVSRKNALLLSIFVMAIPTAMIGMLPTHEQIGILAPILLSVLLIMQGFAIGGEFTGSMVFMIESAPNGRRGAIGSWATFSCVIGVIIGSAISTFITFMLPTEKLVSWGWRIPFLLTILGSAIGTYMRRNIPEPKGFIKEKKEHSHSPIPLKELFTEHWKKIQTVILIDFVTAFGFFILVIFLPTYLQSPAYLNLPASTAMKINTINMFIFAICTLVGGRLSDKYGRKIIFTYVCGVFIMAAYPVFKLFSLNSDYAPFFAQGIIAIHMGLFFGVIPAALSEIFPRHVRFTGLSLSHNISMALFGGSAPFLATYLIEVTSDIAAPAYMLIVASLLCLCGLPLFAERYKESAI